MPFTGNYPWATLNDLIDEMYAHHEELFETRGSKYMLALRLQLQALKDSLDTPPAREARKFPTTSGTTGTWRRPGERLTTCLPTSISSWCPRFG